MQKLYQLVIDNAGVKGTEYEHSFFVKAKEILQAGDQDALRKEKLPLKLLRLTEYAQEGFVLTGFPLDRQQAELLEQYKGGMSAFVHTSLPEEVLLDIEESKYQCRDCGTHYYRKSVQNQEAGVQIKAFMPEDGNCFTCGSSHIVPAGAPQKFEAELEAYRSHKDELLSFYQHVGLLVDFELKRGFDDYDELK